MSIDRLIELVRRDALKIGKFKLASGKQADYYLDCRKLTLSSEGSVVIASQILEMLHDNMPDAVGGMAIGADPITGSVIHAAGEKGIHLNGFIVRKEAKSHGMGRQVEGPVDSNQTAVILEDVVTSGRSSLQAVKHTEDFGLKVQGVIAIVDRLEGAEEAFKNAGIDFRTILTIRDLGLEPSVT